MARLGSWAAAAAIALCAMMVGCASAASSGVDIEKLAALPPSGDVTAHYVFPSYPNKQFPAGKMVEVVVGLHNDGTEAYNLTMIAGSLNSPVDFTVYVQNFSHLTYGQLLGPGQEASLEYKFFPDPRLDPRDFVVALSLVYASQKGDYHALTFFNETINIVELPKLIDWELISLFGFFAAGLAGLGYLLYSYVVSQGWVKSGKQRARAKRAAAASAGPVAMSAEDQQDWVKGTPYDSFVKRNAARAASAGTKRAAATK